MEGADEPITFTGRGPEASSMSDDHEIELEEDRTREEIATVLETFAEGLRDGEAFDVVLGDATATVNPPDTVEFELEIEDEPENGDVERSIEFELEWRRGEDEPELPVE